MNSIVCLLQSDADGYSSAIDAKLGYPKPGVDIGGGIHAPPAQSVTVRYGAVQKHPTLALWAYPDDAAVVAAAIALPIGAVVQVLDATWIPASAMVAAQAEALPE